MSVPSFSREARLTRDYQAHLRAIQISNNELFAYCEGRQIDPYIYSEILSKSGISRSHKFAIHRIEHITGTGGKDALFKLHDYMRTRKHLISKYKGKFLYCVFFVDKDIDDLQRKTRRSLHIFYTALYDIEVHLYRDGNLRRSIAVALSTDVKSIPVKYDVPAVWIESKAFEWRHWLTLCIFSKIYDIQSDCSYKRPSIINNTSDEMELLEKFESFKLNLFKLSKLEKSEFQKKFQKVENKIESLSRDRALSSILKGKWLIGIISSELRDDLFGLKPDFNAFSHKLLTALQSNFDFYSNWSTQIMERLCELDSKVI
jgi:hypothetical protein